MKMFDWWRRRKELRARINADATALITKHGESAYRGTRERALEYRLHKVVDPERHKGAPDPYSVSIVI